MNLFILFLGATLLELYVIISVGEVIGAFSTVVLVVLTAAIGSFLLKQQGRSTLTRAQQTMLSGQMPAGEMLEGLVLVVSGVLLLTPGFITDFVGLLGLMPFSRQAFIKYLINHFGDKFSRQTSQQNTQRSHPQEPEVLEGEFWENKN